MKNLFILFAVFFGFVLNASAQNAQNNFDALCQSQSIEKNMTAGKTYTAEVTFTNTGKKTWSKNNYWIVYTDPRMNARNNNVWGIDNIKLKKNVKPGKSYTFKFKVTAPQEPGIYFFGWILCSDEGNFGMGSETVQINVMK
jgi:hypothetical protein